MPPLLFEKHGFVATLTINRPETRNALGEEGDGVLFSEAAARINGDVELRCAILTGAGTAFSAGGNIKAMRERTARLPERRKTSVRAIAAASTKWCVPYGESKCR